MSVERFFLLVIHRNLLQFDARSNLSSSSLLLFYANMSSLNAIKGSDGADIEAKSSFDNDREILARLGKKQVLKVKIPGFP